MYQQVNIQSSTFKVLHSKFYIPPTQRIYVLGLTLMTTSDYFLIQHEIIGLLTERESVSCAVRTGSSIITHVKLST
jgi:hypothetical protein